MPTVVDALVVTLGLDAKGYARGQAEAARSLKKTGDTARSVAKDMEARGQQAAVFFSKLRNEALAFLAVFTAGVGIKRFTQDTIGGAAQLGILSRNLGMSTRELQAWERASTRAGGSAGGIVEQLKEAQSESAKWKLGMADPSKIAAFGRFGGNFEAFKSGNSLLLARAAIIHRLYQRDPAQARVVAGQLGISEDNFSLFRQGPQAIEKLIEAQKKNSAITQREADQALTLRNRFLDLRDTFTSTGTRIMLALMPAFDKLIGYFQRLANWIQQHQGDIGRWVDMAVQRLGQMVEWVSNHQGDIVAWAKSAIDSFREFVQWINKGVEAMGGWKNVLLIIAGLKIASMLTPLFGLGAALLGIGKALGLISAGAGAVGVITAGVAAAAGAALLVPNTSIGANEGTKLDAMRSKPMASEFDAVNKLMKMGWTREQATGIVANLRAESGMNPGAVGDNGQAIGLAQWHPDRQATIQRQFGKSLRNMSADEQLAAINWELNNGESSAGNALRGATNSQEAARIFAEKFERPAAIAKQVAIRQGYAYALTSAQIANGAPIYDPATHSLSGTVRQVNSLDAPHGGVNLPSTSSTVTIGTVNIQTQATDAKGIARDLRTEVAAQANQGLR
jgi:hypothetical protein